MASTKEVVLRDPLYGYIDLEPEELDVIDTPAFQRLRGVKQVAHTYLVYPSAIHTRFTHSLGAMHVAGLMATQLHLSREDRRLVRLAALLHDVGHGPFSHLFEELVECATKVKADHERIGWSLIDTHQPLVRTLGGDRRKVQDILQGRAGILSKIISGGVDCDKMDYFRRDSFHAGVRYGEYDFDRILRTLQAHNGHIVVPEKGWDAIDGFLLAREQLYLQIYYHKTRIIADEMLKRVVELATVSGSIKERDFRFDPDSPQQFLKQLLTWDDHGFIEFLRTRVTGRARELLEGLLSRRLLKRAYYCDLKDIDAIPRGRLTAPDLSELKEMERCIVQRTRAPWHLVFAKIPAISMKQYYLRGKEELYALRDDGRAENFLDVSKVKGPSEDIVRLIVFCPEEKRDQTKREVLRFIERISR